MRTASDEYGSKGWGPLSGGFCSQLNSTQLSIIDAVMPQEEIKKISPAATKEMMEAVARISMDRSERISREEWREAPLADRHSQLTQTTS